MPAEPLPERWEIQVDVYNGTRAGNAASGMANELAGLAYRIGTVKNADRRTYAETRVYYPPGGEDDRRAPGATSSASARRRSRAATTRSDSSSSSGDAV